MARTVAKEKSRVARLPKSPTGISGLDEITGGGLPRGRPTLVVGSAGSGKTLFGMEFLVRGATEFHEPGVFVAFEETPDELAQNVRTLGFDLKSLVSRKLISLDHIHVERSEIEETGEYDLEGLFVRLGYTIDAIGAKRIVIDTLEALFGGLSDTMLLRSEMRRLFRWLKSKGVTAVITAEQGNGTFTRHGLEEYVSDAVIFLDHRVVDQLSTRRLRVVKYRGSVHGTNEYPFLIDDKGFHVLPITSVGLDHAASKARVPTGVPRLDAMLGGKGYFRGSTVLISGAAGSGKTSMAAHFVDAASRRRERSLYFAFEESESQIIRNMRSIGIDLEPWIDKGLLRTEATRPTLYGLEMHLAKMYRAVREFRPQIVVVDPVTDMMAVGSPLQVKAMLMRLIDFLKANAITTVLTSLTTGGAAMDQTEVGISSLIDTWLLVRELETSGERTRGLYILKSRGMAHSNQVREFLLTDDGVQLVDVYLGPGGVLTGSARAAQQAQERAAGIERAQAVTLKRLEMEHKRKVIQAQIAALQAEFQADEAEFKRLVAQEEERTRAAAQDRGEMAKIRQADDGKNSAKP
jgi:circadian clock protein KaiC